MKNFELTENKRKQIKEFRHKMRKLGARGACYEVSLMKEKGVKYIFYPRIKLSLPHASPWRILGMGRELDVSKSTCPTWHFPERHSKSIHFHILIYGSVLCLTTIY